MTTQKPWYQQDKLWNDLKPVFFSSERQTDAITEVDKITKLIDIKPAVKILDLCCGIGRHSLEFARRGYPVTAVDRTRTYLDHARNRAKSEGLKIDFICQDIRKFQRKSSFDVILNLLTSFGYFEKEEDDRSVVKNMHRSLKTNGTIIFDLMGKEVLARIFKEKDWYYVDDFKVLEERKIIQNWSRVESCWTVIKNKTITEYQISLRLYSAVEISNLLRESGFKQIEVYGDFDGNPYNQNAKRLVVVGKKV
jgi:SAM-dependent methyltransferase